MKHEQSPPMDGHGQDSAGLPGPGWPAKDGSQTYRLNVNGRDRVVDGAWLGESLLYVLRERFGLPGSKNACEQGECGACSVLMDDVLVCSCCVLAADAVDAEIATVESVSTGQELSDVQRALVEDGGVQCGFCTPGIVMAVHDLLAHNPQPDDLEVREALSGNLCRCTGYGRVFAAVRTVAEARSRG